MTKYSKDDQPKLCRTCKWWENRPMDFVFEWCKKLGVQTGAEFGCIHWESSTGNKEGKDEVVI